MKIKSDPSTIDHLIRMEMAKQEHDASIRRAKDEGIDEGIVIGEEKERQKAFLEKIESARKMLQRGLDLSDVADFLGLSLSEVRTLQ